jgi:hypothetical protein
VDLSTNNRWYWISLCRGKPYSNTAVCHNGNSPWQSAFKLGLLTLAIRDRIIFFVAILHLNTAVCHGQRYHTHLSAVCHNRVKSSTGTSHFTSTAPLFAAQYRYLFDARLYKCRCYTCKVYTVEPIRGGLFRPELITNGHNLQTIS